MSASERFGQLVAFFLVGGLVMYPVTGSVQRDDFPLSPFAMFSENKDETTTITQAVGRRADGSEAVLGPKLLATNEVLQAKAVLERVPRSGKRSQADFCKALAGRVASDGALASIVSVEVRTVTYKSLAYFADPTAPPQRSIVHVRCNVERGNG